MKRKECAGCTEKFETIQSLKAKCQELEAQNASLKKKREQLKRDIETLQEVNAELMERLSKQINRDRYQEENLREKLEGRLTVIDLLARELTQRD
jgi:outer membrane murein-binding lipoprotein Lpp